MNLLAGMGRGDDGQTTLEFGLILMVVSTALIGMLTLMFGGLTGYYGKLADLLAMI
jgi:Flp pilus assembly pilin Flp